jgi:hypothetical protein
MVEALAEVRVEPLNISPLPLIPELAANTTKSSTSFEAHTPLSIQENINLLEEDVSVLSRFFSDEEVQEKI